MRRKRHILGAAAIASLLGALGVGLGTAGATAAKTFQFTMTEHGPYACLGPCATATDFVVRGTARSSALGTMTVLGVGHVDGQPNAKNCIHQSERWGFTARGNKGQNSIKAITRGDKICFNKDFSAGVETAALTITGGTGAYKGATGYGRLTFHVLGSPQKGGGTITGVVSLP